MSLLLALETSCDETAAALVQDGRRIVSNVVASQVDLHRETGGIVPEVASREHVLKILPVLEEALSPLEEPAREIDAVAVTHGPGLAGSLLVGVNVAKALAFAWGKPLLAVHHLEAHIYANWLLWGEEEEEPPRFPCLCLVISGGHTSLILMEDHGRYRTLGQTLDDAAGEALDKAARILGLGYPGGPLIEQAARQGQASRYRLPRSWLKGTHDFSFSGLKTALYRLAQEERRRQAGLRYGREEGRPGEVPRLSRAGEFPPLPPQVTADLAASFQEALFEILVRKTAEAAGIYGVQEVLLAGGVAANARLREEMQLHLSVPLRVPPPFLCTDNAAMVGAAGHYHLLRGRTAPWDLDVYPNLPLIGDG